MSTNTRPTIDLESWDDGRQPTRAVAAAALLLGDADTIDASCYGWVPQAHAALAAALDVEEMARALAPSVEDYWCGDHIDDQYDAIDEETDELVCEDCKRARHDKASEAAALVRTAILGEEAKTDA